VHEGSARTTGRQETWCAPHVSGSDAIAVKPTWTTLGIWPERRRTWPIEGWLRSTAGHELTIGITPGRFAGLQAHEEQHVGTDRGRAWTATPPDR
jgi:hypothetical protein